ncbi:hypothetical protein CERZMDRAFT_97988 [Cercospora zeae-maydis SCOH1-5]|uniref:Uncharacterized protein n=1 Tax=Cercospora zeae-maydis SCOH1-5 TaxID=717836 RepID=A0A6A6FFG8_9PEZI|nr:hypothetical protein CERZMDRAFT_97988 [Cercospora zeae-maydis SCOH1-5]
MPHLFSRLSGRRWHSVSLRVQQARKYGAKYNLIESEQVVRATVGTWHWAAYRELARHLQPRPRHTPLENFLYLDHSVSLYHRDKPTDEQSTNFTPEIRSICLKPAAALEIGATFPFCAQKKHVACLMPDSQ